MPKSPDSRDLANAIAWAPRPSRREFLTYMGAAVAAAACGGSSRSGANTDGPPAPPTLAVNPFKLGVASGDPAAESVILWTRLAMDPLAEGGMPDEDVPVLWEVALDPNFAQIVASGWKFAVPALGHSVHVDVEGLGPDTWYWYRFQIEGQWTSPVARTRTLPAPDAHPESFRIISASCQSYASGFYTAHHHLAQEDVDLVAFLGDYIYEGPGGSGLRSHFGPRLQTLAHFRNRYAQYRLDPNLQAAHHRCPWVVTWDDHEVANNYANLDFEPNRDGEDHVALRRAAYQAYYEHMPLRIPQPDDFGSMQIYRAFDIGDLIRLYVLDGRQYRTNQPCNDQFVRCPEVDSPDNTMLGSDQKDWLKEAMSASPALWNMIAQQTVFAPMPLGPSFMNPDQWDGYAFERQELLTLFRDIRNVVIATGDIHAAGLAVLHADARDANSDVVGIEFVTTSISSGGDGGDDLLRLVGRFLDMLPHIRYANTANRGYTVYDINRQRLRAYYRVVSSVTTETADLATDAAFEVEADSLNLTSIE